ncbi:dTDP-4-dehydrorhamnose reductase [Candidatus Peregrinibacteria bacterium]|nr:dTDP-4-dehydrorhamnose reductase [Candidatus Peregrinibacteria bacterium]
MKILLLGKSGLLGQALFSALQTEHEVVGFSHAQCDVTQESSLEDVFAKTSPDLVINATGYTQVDKAEEEKDLAFEVNKKAVSNIIKLLKPKNTPLVHFSTDYVFNGENTAGYTENDFQAPLSVYGASKAAGEAEIIKNLKNYYLIRTAWLYGPGGKNFVDTMLLLAEKRAPIKVVNDQIGNPTLSTDLAQSVLRLLKGKSYGIYHLVNEGDVSWYDFAVAIFENLGVPQKVMSITTAELNRPAHRPHYSMLRNTKFEKLRPWQEALAAYLKEKTLIL